MLPEFERNWQHMGLKDAELRELQDALLKDPSAGVVVKGTGGLRKLRFALPGIGKRSGCRVAYVDFPEHETLYLLTAYPKSEKDNLTKAERNAIAGLVSQLKRSKV